MADNPMNTPMYESFSWVAGSGSPTCYFRLDFLCHEEQMVCDSSCLCRPQPCPPTSRAPSDREFDMPYEAGGIDCNDIRAIMRWDNRH